MASNRPRTGRPGPARRGSELSASTRRRAPFPVEDITRVILILRGHRVLLDSELAALYGVETRVLNQAVRRNPEPFPEDFRFQLTPAEAAASRSQSVTLKPGAARTSNSYPSRLPSTVPSWWPLSSTAPRAALNCSMLIQSASA